MRQGKYMAPRGELGSRESLKAFHEGGYVGSSSAGSCTAALKTRPLRVRVHSGNYLAPTKLNSARSVARDAEGETCLVN
jgi:hypothetical protein